MEENKMNMYPVFVALTVALGGFLLGFDGVVNGGAVPFYRVSFGISDKPFLIGLSSSAIILGAIFGNFSVGMIMDKLGRKPCLMITSVLFMVGAAGTALATNVIFFIACKLIAGLGVGIAILVAPMYIAEIAPPKQRGWLVTFNQLNIVLGLSIAMLSNYFILKNVADPDMNWRWMLGVGFFPAALYFVLLFFVPESPRWLIQKGRDEEGLKVLRKSCGSESENEFQSIKKALSESDQESKVKLSELFSRKMNLILLIGFGLAIFQQLSGINAVLYYAPMIFESAGSQMDAAFLMAITVGLVFTVATLVSMFLIDRLGRRPLLIIGCIVMASSFLIVSYAFKSGSYSISKSDIESVADQALRSDINALAKEQYPQNYIADSTVIGSQVATLYLEGKSIAEIDLGHDNIKKGIEHNELMSASLTPLIGNKHTDEKSYFDTVKKNYLASAASDQETASQRFSVLYKPAILKASIEINTFLVLLGILGFIAGFSISLGPVMWAMFSEIFPTRLRAKAIAIVGATNAFTSFIIATVFPMELEYLGSANTYLIFGICMVCCLGFVIKYIPETKGKSLEELETELIGA